MRPFLAILPRAIVAFAAILFALWGSGALLFQLPVSALAASPAVAQLAASAFALSMLGGIVGLFRRRWALVVQAALAAAALVMWWGTITPTHQRDWIPELARLPRTSIAGETLSVTNLRNFRWTSGTTAEERWDTRDFDLSRLRGADMALSYWSGEAIAHMIVTFVFADSPPLALSIEVRREKGEEWSSVAGFFRRYELAYVAADERDLIGLRTHHRGEDVRLFQLRATPGQARDVLLAYAADINALSESPRWYNTLATNCTTLAFTFARGLSSIWGLDLPLDPRMLLTGHLPGYLRQVGALRADMPLADLVAASRISSRAREVPLDDPAFSAKIRVGLPERLQARP